ncbi:MAG: AmmeMemoRadiSam system protein B [Phycisphaerae bacterium]|nr:AmmeMemoRadiSam system protein B [Phycisphaerae bacterium]
MSIAELPEHIRRPHVRPLQPLPVQAQNKEDGKTTMLVGLRDPSMLTNQMMVVPPQAVQVIQHFRGERTLEEIAALFKAEAEPLGELAGKMDEFGLLWGPTFERLESEMKEKLRADGYFPISASGMLGTDEAACRKQLDSWLAETEDPELDVPAIGVIAPHLDYARGWPVYAASYRCFDRAARPDRIVVLGTNHFGIGDGVVVTDLGFKTPLGAVASDRGIIEKLRSALGERLFIDQLDHLPEHSVQLHLPWIQHRWGNVPLVAALIPDPLSPMIADDGARVGREEFVRALCSAIDDSGGTTYVVASSDLSHVGPQFGEPVAVNDQRKLEVERHDRELMGRYLTGDPKEFVGACQWTKNPTRWCSIGNMTAALEIARPASVELVDYRQACDDQGLAMVTSCSMALLGRST